MKTSATISEISQALVLAVGEIKPVKKDAKNPFLKNKYASLDAIIEGSKSILAAHNLCVIQTVTEGVETTIIHSSGEWISSDIMTIPVEVSKGLSSAQARGVAITYCKRYQLGAILGISTDEDTDGSYPEEPKPETKQEPKPEPKTKGPIKMTADAWMIYVERMNKGEKLADKIRAAYILTDEQEKTLKLYEKEK